MNGDVKILTMMVGLPRSGKSTAAHRMSEASGAPIVCPDAIRWSIYEQRFIASVEPYVWAIAKTMVRALFLAGHDRVILDATNLVRKNRDEWRSKEWTRRFEVITVGTDECVLRAKESGREDLITVIHRMAALCEPVQESERD